MGFFYLDVHEMKSKIVVVLIKRDPSIFMGKNVNHISHFMVKLELTYNCI